MDVSESSRRREGLLHQYSVQYVNATFDSLSWSQMCMEIQKGASPIINTET